jgi:tripartite-type tricarboxylate transporter receptor subunit TctC
MQKLNGFQAMLRILLTAVALVGTVATSPVVQAQAKAWPDKSIKLIVGFPPGGGSDAISRIIAILMIVL